MADNAAAAELSESTTEARGEAARESVAETGEGSRDVKDDAPPGPRADRLALVTGLVLVVALSGLLGWVGFRAYQSHQAQEQRKLFLQVGRQGALNLTTIDFHEVNADVQRLLDGATGQLYDSFSKRSQPFIDVVLRTQSKSVGTVTEAAVESQSGDQAQVLVAVTVNTSNAGAAQQEPHSWRMRLSVQKVGGVVKVSNVEFVP
jgi:Mce-associated membrane protein